MKDAKVNVGLEIQSDDPVKLSASIEYWRTRPISAVNSPIQLCEHSILSNLAIQTKKSVTLIKLPILTEHSWTAFQTLDLKFYVGGSKAHGHVRLDNTREGS